MKIKKMVLKIFALFAASTGFMFLNQASIFNTYNVYAMEGKNDDSNSIVMEYKTAENIWLKACKAINCVCSRFSDDQDVKNFCNCEKSNGCEFNLQEHFETISDCLGKVFDFIKKDPEQHKKFCYWCLAILVDALVCEFCYLPDEMKNLINSFVSNLRDIENIDIKSLKLLGIGIGE